MPAFSLPVATDCDPDASSDPDANPTLCWRYEVEQNGQALKSDGEERTSPLHGQA